MPTTGDLRSVIMGEFEADLVRGVLRRCGGDAVRLHHHTFELLRILILYAPEVVRRDDLLRIVWQGEGRSRHVIDQAITELRSAFGDDARSPRFIETIPKVGYRLCIPLERMASASSFGHAMLDVETLTLYGLAREYFKRRTRASVQRSLSYFRTVVERYPCFVPGLLGVTDCLTLLAHVGFPVFTPAQVLPEAQSALRQAIKLATEPELKAAALTGFAKLNLMFHWNFTQAEQQLLAAKALDPTHAAVYQCLGHLFLVMNRFEDSLEAITQARRCAPSSAMIHGTSGWLLHHMGQHSLAIERCLDTTRHHPEFAVGYIILGLAYEALGQTAEAEAALWTSQNIEPSPVPLGALRHLYASTGNIEGVRRATETLYELARSGVPVTSYHDALAYAGFGMYDDAMAALLRACDEQCDWMIYLPVDPRWKQLRKHPEYNQLLRRVRLQKFWKEQTER